MESSASASSSSSSSSRPPIIWDSTKSYLQRVIDSNNTDINDLLEHMKITRKQENIEELRKHALEDYGFYIYMGSGIHNIAKEVYDMSKKTLDYDDYSHCLFSEHQCFCPKAHMARDLGYFRMLIWTSFKVLAYHIHKHGFDPEFDISGKDCQMWFPLAYQPGDMKLKGKRTEVLKSAYCYTALKYPLFCLANQLLARVRTSDGEVVQEKLDDGNFFTYKGFTIDDYDNVVMVLGHIPIAEYEGVINMFAHDGEVLFRGGLELGKMILFICKYAFDEKTYQVMVSKKKIQNEQEDYESAAYSLLLLCSPRDGKAGTCLCSTGDDF